MQQVMTVLLEYLTQLTALLEHLIGKKQYMSIRLLDSSCPPVPRPSDKADR